MRGLIAGCMCAGGAGVWALGGAGHDAEVTVHKPPQAVYAAVSSAFTDMEVNEVIPARDDGGSVAFQVTVDRQPGESVSSTVLVGGEEAATIAFTVAPAADGAETTLSGDIDVDQAVLRKYLKDGPNGDVARIPAFAFDLAMKAALRDMAEKIEAGMPLEGPRESFANMRTQQRQGTPTNLDEKWAAQSRRYAEQEKMHQATKPVLDPNAAAREYLKKP